jgi:cytochrome P450
VVTHIEDVELPWLDLDEVDRERALDQIEKVAPEHWVVRTPLGYNILRYQDVVAMLRERRFHSALAGFPEYLGVDDELLLSRHRNSLFSLEGAEHTRLRRILVRYFTPAAAENFRFGMRATLLALIERCPVGEFDLVEQVCDPYPVQVICHLLGAPEEDGPRLSHWASVLSRIFSPLAPTLVDAIKGAAVELGDYVDHLINVRGHHRGGDVLSHLLSLRDAGELTHSEVRMLSEAVLMAGVDTIRNQLGLCVAVLHGRRDVWRLLALDPSSSPRIVDETMRVMGAARGTVRIASEDIEYRGLLFPAGTLVTMSFVAANLDKDFWPQGTELDVTETHTCPHTTFGSGIHYCLGASLARAELSEALATLASAFPDLRLTRPIEWKPPTFGIWGPARVFVRNGWADNSWSSEPLA